MEARNLRFLRIIPSFLIVVVLTTFTCGKVIYVDDDATGANDGTSWADAYVYLQDALADANYLEKPVDIMVAQGIYKPDQGANQTPSDREASFHLINGVTLKGGFAGFGEPDPNARDIELFESVLSGDINGDDPQIPRRRRINRSVTLLAEDAAKQALVPKAPISDNWISSQVSDDSPWLSGTGGVGYERSMGYERFIGLDVTADMYALNSTCYIRIPFTVDANDLIDCNFITLNIRYDDAFIAYINGIEVARRNFTGTPSWDCQADEPHADSSAVVFEPIDIFNQIDILQEGENLLAIHGMNISATSSDFLISVELLAEQSKEYEEYIEENEVDAQRLPTDPNRAENSYHVLTASGTGRTATLDGFTICGGNANIHAAWPSLTAYGGGIYNRGGNPTLLNCNFTHNSALQFGGGMYNITDDDNCDPILVDCTFSGNWAGYSGGGMRNCGEDGANDVILIGCVFTGNQAGWDGGGMSNHAVEGWCRPTLTNCIFNGNRAGEVGGGMNNSNNEGWCRPTLTNCTFIGNSADWSGGGMYNSGSSPTLANCNFSGNSALALHGGGMCNSGSSPILANCNFSGNSALALHGGGMYNYGSSPTLANCNFSGNSARDGGGMYNSGSSPTLINCTFAQNSAQYGNALGCYSYKQRYPSNVELINCIIWDGGNEIWNNDNSIIDLTYTNIQGGFPGEGNIDVEPLFAVPGYCDPNGTPDDPNDDFWIDGDYHLKSEAGRWDPVSESWVIDDVTSPCIDAGDPNSPVAFEPFPNGGIINMGAYGGTAEASKSPSGLHAKYDYGGGTGEPNDPYLIYTPEQMNEIGLHEEDWDKHFILINDIDLSAYNGTQFNIIGRYFGGDHPNNKAFSGVFDGNGKVIRNFTWNSVDRDTVALFAFLDWNATGPTVKNLGLEEVNIRAENGYEVAALAARNEGDIANCYVTGYVSGRREVGGLVADAVDGHVVDCYSLAVVEGDQAVGGLVGTTDEDASITRCYSCSIVAGNGSVGGLVGKLWGPLRYSFSNSTVTGDSRVGGLVGVNSGDGLIVDCYARGSVTGTTSVGGLAGVNSVNEDEGPGLIHRCYSSATVRGEGEHIGGLVGWNEAHIISCFWDRQASGMDNMCGEKHYGVGCDDSRGKTTAEMQMASTFLVWGWCNEGVWTIDEGNDYPRLWWEDMGGETLTERLSDIVTGSGEPNDPYLIYTAEELNMIGLFCCEWDKHFKLMGDIDLSAYSGTQFNIIGFRSGDAFTGVFDGNGKKISNFSYASTNTFSVGLFGYVYRGVIKDLGLIAPNISGRYDVGSLVGRLQEGTITNCYCKGGSISGGSIVGGLVGYNFGTLSDCYATGAMSGGSHVGGLVGQNWRLITNCYATGSVSGNDSVGGLVGTLNWEGATITNCYSSATVTGTTDVGGLIGRKSEYGTPTVIYSFWDTQTSGRVTSDGGTGKTTAEMKTAGTFLNAGWDFVDETANGTEDIWWIIEGQDYPRLWWELLEDDSPALADN